MTAQSDLRLEFMVEPFAAGRPGRHVARTVEAVERHGLDVELGPFSNTTSGTAPDIVAAVGDLVRAAVEEGATRVSVQVVTEGADHGLHVGGLHDALDRMISQVEAELGGKLADFDRDAKQAAVRMLDERGAFLLRKAIEDVADTMGVSRITIYNYLNAIKSEEPAPT